MDFSPAYKNEIERKIVEAIANAIENQILTEGEVAEVARYVLDTIDTINSQQQLVEFLRNLSSKWTFFSNLLVLESGEIQHQKDTEAASKILELAKSGNIDEALHLAKSSTNNT